MAFRMMDRPGIGPMRDRLDPHMPALPSPVPALPLGMRPSVGSHTGKSRKEGDLTTPFVDPAFGTEKKPALSTIGLTGDGGKDCVIGVKLDGVPSEALDYIKSISK